MQKNNQNTNIFKHASGVYPYTLVRSARKSISLAVTPQAAIVVRAPHGILLDMVEDFMRRKISWIAEKQEYFRQNKPTLSSLKYVAGESYYYLGEQYTLEVGESNGNNVELAEGRIIVSTTSNTQKVYEHWLGKQTISIFMERYLHVSKKFAYKDIPRLEIRSMRTRWGSYRSRDSRGGNAGSIALSSKLIHAPLSTIDYVIHHELCHHTHKDHSKNFYNLLENKLPTWKEEKQKLTQYGMLLD